MAFRLMQGIDTVTWASCDSRLECVQPAYRRIPDPDGGSRRGTTVSERPSAFIRALYLELHGSGRKD